jgi:hypothetical protein
MQIARDEIKAFTAFGAGMIGLMGPQRKQAQV